MKTKKKVIAFLLLIVVSSLVLCSRLDSYTGAGSGIITDIDSSLLDFSSRFSPIVFDSAQILMEEFSLPDTIGMRFGSIPDFLICGERDSVYYYGVSNFVFLYKDMKNRFESKIVDNVVDSIAIVYNIQSDTILGTTIADTSSLYLVQCDTNTSYKLPEDPLNQYQEADIDWTITTDSMLIGKFKDTSLIDSIFSLCKYPFTDSNSDTSWRREINLSLFNTGSNLMLLNKSSYLLIYTHNSQDNKSRIDTIYTYSFSMVSEKQSKIEQLKVKRVSSIPTKRTAVFKMDLSKLWEILEVGGTKEILSASLVFEIDSTTEIYRDTIAFAVCLISDSLYKDGIDLSYQIDTLHRYHLEYVKIDPSKDSLIFFPIHKQLQYYAQKKNNIMYAYIQLARISNKENYSIYWKKPSLKILLTEVN